MSAPANQDAIFRAQHVGGSEVAALFGVSPWLTEFELWHRKTGSIATPDFNTIHSDGTPENERIFWGVKLEAAIIDAAKERYGYTDRIPAADFPPLTNGRGLGGHPDRRVICPERGPGLVEVKMVDWLVRKGWGDEPPLNYLLQANTYTGLDGAGWFDLLVLVGGNKLERFKYEFRPKLFAETEKRVEAFWQSVRKGNPPKPDYTRDGDTIAELYAETSDEVVDMKGDNLAMIAAGEWLRADAECKDAAARRDAARAELMDKLEHATVGLLDGITIKAPEVKVSPDKIITEKMVGEVLKGRRAFRRFSIKEKELT